MAKQQQLILVLLLVCRYEMGRQAANTKLSTHVAVRRVRVRGGNYKFRALRLDHGNYSWGSEVRQQLWWWWRQGEGITAAVQPVWTEEQ